MLRGLFSKLFKVFLRLALLGGGFLFVSALAFALWTAKDLPSPDAFGERQIVQSTKIFDRSGEILLYELHGEEKRTVIEASAIPQHVKDAVVAVEDARFWVHLGLDPKAIARAILADLRGLRIEQGGSTITQQLARNALLTRERTLTRKTREAILAIELEIRYSKEEILTFYLNQIPFGSNAYGIESAAKTFFGKPAKELTIAEAAMLAAAIQAPSYYSPYGSNKQELEMRRHVVLDRMQKLGYLTEEQRDQAKEETPVVQPPARNISAPHFVFFVREYLEARFGADYLEQAGLNVVTTLDWRLQEIAERAIREGVQRNEKRWNAENAALVALDPETGQILTMVGSRDYFDVEHDGNVNVTTRPRQPGSSFKPIVYAAAFENGFTPNTVVFDLATEFGVPGAESYQPENYDGAYRGPVTMRDALANSLNVPSVKTLYLAGIDDSIAVAERFGITTLTARDQYGLALVLGGGAVTLLEETAAFGVFAQEGVRYPPVPILYIADAQGNILEEFQPQPLRVLDRNIARMITDILSDNEARALTFGTRTPLVLKRHPAAAKTGTTQDFRDGWTIGYTPNIAAGVWVGNNDYSQMRKGAAGVTIAAPIWKQFMDEALAETPAKAFGQPTVPEAGKPVLDGVFLVEETIDIDRISGKRATEYTPRHLIEKQTYTQIHSILWWVDKKDPAGAIPQDPSKDPQFPQWEKTVRTWVEKQPDLKTSFINELPPQDFDDVHLPGYVPTLSLLSPQAERFSQESRLLVAVLAQGHFPTEEVVLFFDGRLEKELFRESGNRYTTTLNLARYETGPHTITVRAFDEVGNTSEIRISIFVADGQFEGA